MFRLFISLLSASILFSCQERSEGPNGLASIKGKVYVKDYNSTFSRINDHYYGAKEDVYIIYGDEEVYGDNMETHYDGSYEFKNLTLGTYKIYAYTEDTTLKTSNLIPVIKTVEITEEEQTVEVEDIVIAK